MISPDCIVQGVQSQNSQHHHILIRCPNINATMSRKPCDRATILCNNHFALPKAPSKDINPALCLCSSPLPALGVVHLFSEGQSSRHQAPMAYKEAELPSRAEAKQLVLGRIPKHGTRACVLGSSTGKRRLYSTLLKYAIDT